MPDLDEIIQQASSNLPADKKIYFNGYTFQITAADVTIVLQVYDQPVAILSASHSVTKTLALAIEKLLSKFEEDTEQHIWTIDEISQSVSQEKS